MAVGDWRLAIGDWLKISSNPATDTIRYGLSTPVKDAIFSLYDLSGQSLMRQIISGQSGEMDISSFPAGAYILSLQTDRQVYSQKLIVMYILKATFYEGNHNFSISDIKKVAPAKGEVRIKVAYCGVCGIDIHIYHGMMDKRVNMPLTIGHEFANFSDPYTLV